MVDEATVRARIGSREGSPYDTEQVSRDVRTIFELGSFEDVKVDAEGFEGGVRLTFRITERPLLLALEIEGNDEISTDDLREKAALALSAPYNPVAAAAAVERMRALYREKGFYQATIRTELEPAGEGRVRLKAVVEENTKYRLISVSLTGVTSLPVDEVLGEMKTEPWTIFSWISGSGKLQQEVLQEDRQRIVSYYQDRGYLEVRVGEPEITVDDTAKSVRVAIAITEGQQFRLGSVTQEGDDFLTLEEIKRLVGLKEGEIFRRSAFAQGVFAMNQRYSSRGFAFVKLDYATRLDQESRTIDVTFLVERGPQARFGRITVSGNVTTLDKIIRRELTFSEGDVFNSEALRRSRQKVTNLGFFETVDVVPRPRGESEIDVDIEVKEKLTGAITFGVGYSSEDKLTGQVRVSENNLFGHGYSLALTFEKSPVRANYSLTFNDPSLFDSRWSAGFSIYNTEREYDEYDRKSIGGSLTFGRSLGEFLRSYVRLKHETVTLSNVTENAGLYLKAQEGTATTNSVRLTFVRDTRDNFMNPTRGNRTSLSGEYAGGILGGDNYFTKFEIEHSSYVPLFWGLVGMIHGEYGKVGIEQGVQRQLMTSRQPITWTAAAIYEKFYLGGILTMRGFQYRSVGPTDANGEPTGGTQQLYFNAEVIVPLAPTQGFNLVVFYDTGNAWDARGLDGSAAERRRRHPLAVADGALPARVGPRPRPPAGRAEVRLGLHDRQLLLVVTAAGKGPSAALPPRGRLRRAAARLGNRCVGALHLDPSEQPLRTVTVDLMQLSPVKYLLSQARPVDGPQRQDPAACTETNGFRLPHFLRARYNTSLNRLSTGAPVVPCSNTKGVSMHMPARIAAAAALCILLAAGAAAAQEPVKLGFVDMQKALNESKAGKKALGELQKLMEARKSGLQQQKETLERKKDELDKQGLLLNEETRKSRESEVRTLERDYSRTLSDLKEEFGRRESEFTDGIRKDLLKVIEKIGKEEGYTLVLEKQYSAILYAPATIDLTEALIKRYDAESAK